MKQQPLTVCQEGKGRVRFTIKHKDTNMNLAKRVLIKYKIKANSIFVAKFLRGSAAKIELYKPDSDFCECGVKGREEVCWNFFCPGMKGRMDQPWERWFGVAPAP